MPDIFISYNREDRERARVVASALEAEGVSVWWDAALRAGETYDEVTEQNLRSAGAVVVLWSKRSANSKWVRAEATVGERSSTLVPVLIEDCERPIRFELVQTADLRHWQGDRNDPHWRAFMQDIKTAISKRSAKQSPQQAAAPSAPAGPDATIETAFWNSIKDGTDRSDFEAYLSRYPNGHFAALAHNRLAALNRPASQTPQQKPAPQAQRPAAAPAPRPAQAQAATTRPAPRPAAAPAQAPEKKSGNGFLIGGIAIAVITLGAVAFLLMPKQGGETEAAATVAAAESEPTTPAVPSPEPAVTETAAADAPVTDVYADGADETGATDLIAADPEEAPVDIAPDVFEVAPEPAAASAPAATAASVTATAKKVSQAKTFRDCEECPMMARLPAGDFVMGSPSSEAGRNAYEGPQVSVKVPAFAIGVYEVTNAEWNACAADGDCPKKSGDAKSPALGLSWREAVSFTDWLSKKTGRKYRLPSEAEWEYAARAGSVSAYWWGENYVRSRIATGTPSAIGSFDANAFGLHDVLGNAREWVADCYVNNFTKLPTDGSAATDGDCSKRVIRGGAWSSAPVDLRIANRSRIDAGTRAGYMGLRVAAEAKK